MKRRHAHRGYSLNKHINFNKERHKTNSRKDLTNVFCCVCKKEFVLPFKPRRPEVYCDSCFKKVKSDEKKDVSFEFKKSGKKKSVN